MLRFRAIDPHEHYCEVTSTKDDAPVDVAAHAEDNARGVHHEDPAGDAHEEEHTGGDHQEGPVQTRKMTIAGLTIIFGQIKGAKFFAINGMNMLNLLPG